MSIMTKQDLIIIGGQGNCLDIAEAALLQKDCFNVLGFLDDTLEAGANTPLDLPVLGSLNDAGQFPKAFFINGVGSPSSYTTKARLLQRMNIAHERFTRVVHPSAVVSRSAMLAKGCAILSHCDVGNKAVLEEHVFLLQQCVVGHDSIIEAGTILATGVKVSGRVRVGSGAYLGAGSIIREGVSIGAGCLVGTGSVVVSNLPAFSICYGIPARKIKDA